jgi:hypothetical protein
MASGSSRREYCPRDLELLSDGGSATFPSCASKARSASVDAYSSVAWTSSRNGSCRIPSYRGRRRTRRIRRWSRAGPHLAGRRDAAQRMSGGEHRPTASLGRWGSYWVELVERTEESAHCEASANRRRLAAVAGSTSSCPIAGASSTSGPPAACAFGSACLPGRAPVPAHGPDRRAQDCYWARCGGRFGLPLFMGARLRRCAVPALRDRLALSALSDNALAGSRW